MFELAVYTFWAWQGKQTLFLFAWKRENLCTVDRVRACFSDTNADARSVCGSYNILVQLASVIVCHSLYGSGKNVKLNDKFLFKYCK